MGIKKAPSYQTSVLWAGFGPPNSPPYTCRRVKSLNSEPKGQGILGVFSSHLPFFVSYFNRKLCAQILTEKRIKLGQVTGPHKSALTLRRQSRKRKSHLSFFSVSLPWKVHEGEISCLQSARIRIIWAT